MQIRRDAKIRNKYMEIIYSTQIYSTSSMKTVSLLLHFNIESPFAYINTINFIY
jgi:hypothetical protein